MLRNLMLNISSYAQHSVLSQYPPDLLTTLAIVGTLAILGTVAFLGTLAILDTLEILDTLGILAILAMLATVDMLGIMDILDIHPTVILQTLAISTIEDKIITIYSY